MTVKHTAAAVIAALLLVTAASGLHAQAAAQSRQIGSEIQYLRNRLAVPMTAAERHGLLVNLARLSRLSGDFAGAASAWLEAAALNPADDLALVSGAYSLAAIGEWERAALTVRPLIASGITSPAVIRARYLYATIRAWMHSDTALLMALAADPTALAIRPAVYYTLWWTETRDPATFGDNAEAWRQRLLSTFPASPEARIAVDTPSVTAMQSPLWLLLPGLPTGTPLGIPADSTLAGLIASPGTLPPATVPQVFTYTHGRQTGLFRSEANARTHAQTLTLSGFPATVTGRLVSGVEHWTVVVPTADPDRTALELRAAGHESFTVRLGQ